MRENHVVTCFVEYAGQVLIVKRSSRVGTYQHRWSGISGYLEPENSPLEQAWQELAEETGLQREDASLVKEGESLTITDEQLDRTWMVHPFRFQIANPGKIQLDWENTDYQWISPEEINNFPTVPGLADAWGRVQ